LKYSLGQSIFAPIEEQGSEKDSETAYNLGLCAVNEFEKTPRSS
jgi:hypothetical protein